MLQILSLSIIAEVFLAPQTFLGGLIRCEDLFPGNSTLREKRRLRDVSADKSRLRLIGGRCLAKNRVSARTLCSEWFGKRIASLQKILMQAQHDCVSGNYKGVLKDEKDFLCKCEAYFPNRRFSSTCHDFFMKV